MKKILIAAAVTVLCAGLFSACAGVAPNNASVTEENIIMNETGRTVIDFDGGWKFLKLTQKDGLSELAVETIDFDDSTWEDVTLPHTWNAIDGADGWSGTDEGGEHYYRGLGGYRKTYVFPSELSGKRIYMEFEGANTVTELYINQKLVGKHEGGYAAFRFDITDFIKLGEKNSIAVKVSNAPTDYIAPITNQGDFTKMGGIYRDVSIIAVEPMHIDLMDYGASGIYITPKNISTDHADIDVLVKLANDGSEKKNAAVAVDILDTDGKAVASGSAEVTVPANGKTETTITIPLDNPILWNGVQNPYLYSARVTVSDGEAKVDSLAQAFGIRTYYIDPDKGFFLNGEYLDLRGVNYHQDSFENGWAMTDEQRERDYKMMREMGCTAVRMAHYQHDSYEYDLCDRLGLTVWTEIGIVNKMSANDDLVLADGFAENAKQQLRELIRQNYNHPSIIIWGTSNELYQMSDEIFDIYTELNELANQEDDTRLISFADAQFWGRFLKLPGDAVGYNRYFGWYIDGTDGSFGRWLDDYHNNKESRGIAVTEYGGGAAISQHKDNIVWASDIDSWGERHYENYQSAMHEDIWAQFSERPYLWGKYIWCMFDFASDGRQEGDTKGQNDKGLVTRERVPKDAYYFYKSVWNDEPMLHLTEKRFTERPSLVPQIKAYSNAESVELFVDGKSMGKIYRSDLDENHSTVFVWENVQIKEDNASEIKVVATLADGSTLEDTASWTGYYVEPEVPMVNVALNKPIVYVSSEENGNSAEKINDGSASDSSRWCAASASDYPASVIIDLEKNYSISKIKVVTHKPGARAYKFTVSVSGTQDGEYTVISDHSENTDTSGYFTDMLEEPFNGRYVKIEVTGCSDTNAYPCIWELEVYEDGSAVSSGSDSSHQGSGGGEATAPTAAISAGEEDMATQFMDCFEPMPIINKLSDDCWGAEKVGSRDQDNGLEDKTMIVRSEDDAEHDYTYWDGGIIKDDRDPTGQTYYMFASRWDATTGSHYDWAKSQAIVAISTTGLYGPYEDKGLIWQDNADGKGHNIFPLKLKEDDPSGYKYAIVACETRPTEIFCSQSLDGPWTSVCQLQHQADEDIKSHGIEPKYVDTEGKSRSRFNGKNICIFIRPDGRYQAFGRDGDIALADSIAGPWTVVSEYTKEPEDKTLWDMFPSMNSEKMEDPVMWYSDGLYHCIVNSWEVKEASYLTSENGISDWTLQPGKAYTPKASFIKYTDGTVNRWTKLERPNVYIEDGKVTALTFAAIDCEKWEDKANDEHGSKIIVVPFNHDKLIRFVTGKN